MASVFNPLILRLRAARRLGAFSRALRQGMSTEQARIYSDGVYPPTPTTSPSSRGFALKEQQEYRASISLGQALLRFCIRSWRRLILHPIDRPTLDRRGRIRLSESRLSLVHCRSVCRSLSHFSSAKTNPCFSRRSRCFCPRYTSHQYSPVERPAVFLPEKVGIFHKADLPTLRRVV
jgi:hypothetical protein